MRPRAACRWVVVAAAGIVLAGVGVGWVVDSVEQDAPTRPVDTEKLAEMLLPTAGQRPPDCAVVPPIMRFLQAPCEQR